MKKNLMHIVAVILGTTLLSSLAMADSELSEQDKNLIYDTINGYETQDLQRACSISFNGTYFKVNGKEGRRDSVGLRIHSVSKEGQFLALTYAYYDGEGRIILQKIYNDEFLYVMASYEDKEFDDDLATFCVLHRHTARN